MKIISKHKEYYDYLTGIYGIDELLVYDRRTDLLFKPIESDSIIEYKFAICNKIYYIIQYNKNFYHTIDELTELNNILIKENIGCISNSGFSKYISPFYKKDINIIHKILNYETNVNKINREPVLVSTVKSFYKDVDLDWSIPFLSEFNFARWIEPTDIYNEISQFISWLKDNPQIPNNQTNKEKILSHGFDFKKSFRHRNDN